MEKNIEISDIGLLQISKDQLDLLTKINIYFGHQSVGFNIIDGIKKFAQDINYEIGFIELNENKIIKGNTFFAHGRIGKNREPVQKFNDFYEVIKHNSDRLDIAFMKFCYVDIQYETDIHDVFNKYKKLTDNIRKNFPDVTIIHFTVPLETSKVPMKYWFKMFRAAGLSYKWHMIKNINKISRHESNITRNRYNDMIRETFSSELIFDIAKIESTHPNGNLEQFKHDDKVYYSLAPEYTYDGGHLNDVGKKVVASNLLSFLIEKTKKNKLPEI